MNEPLYDQLVEHPRKKPVNQSLILGTTESYYVDDVSDSDELLERGEASVQPDLLSKSFIVGSDILQYQDSFPHNYMQIDWAGAIVLFFISLLLLPFYVIAMIVDIRKHYPTLLSKQKSRVLFGIALTFYICLWATIGIWIGQRSKMALVPLTEILFIILFYTVCCVAEAVLRSSFFITDPEQKQVDEQLSNVKIISQTIPEIVDELSTIKINEPVMGYISVIDLIRKIRTQTLNGKTQIAIRSSAAILSFIFALTVEVSRWFLIPAHIDKTISVALIFYIIFSFILRWSMAGFLFHYLGEAIIQLYCRWHQTQWCIKLNIW